MPKIIGYEPRLPKPGNQGTAKTAGPGSGTPKRPIRGGNSQATPGMRGLRTKPTKGPGSGTRGVGRSRNSASRT